MEIKQKLGELSRSLSLSRALALSLLKLSQNKINTNKATGRDTDCCSLGVFPYCSFTLEEHHNIQIKPDKMGALSGLATK